MTEIRGFVSAPRWLDIENDLRRAAIVAGVQCETERTTSFLRQTVYYTLRGEAEDVRRLQVVIEDVVAENTPT